MASETLLKLIRQQGGDAGNWYGKPSSPPDPRVQKLRKLFRGKSSGEGHHGAKMMREMTAYLRANDLDDDGVMSFPEFKLMIRKLQREVTLPDPLTAREVEELYEMVDPMKCGYVLFDDFFRAVLGNMTSEREKLVEIAYNKLDVDRDGSIDADELISFYKKNSGTKSTGVSLNERKMYEIINNFGIANSGKLTKDEFFNYYRNMSFFTDSDHIFENELCDTWCITFSELVASTRKEPKKKSAKGFKELKEKIGGFVHNVETKAVKKLIGVMFPSAELYTPALQEAMTWAGDLEDGNMSLAVFKGLLKKKQKKDTPEEQWLTGGDMEKLFNMIEPSKEGHVHFASFYDALKQLCDTLSSDHLDAPKNSTAFAPNKPETESPTRAAATSAIFNDPSRGGKVRKALVEQLKASAMVPTAADNTKIKPQEPTKPRRGTEGDSARSPREAARTPRSEGEGRTAEQDQPANGGAPLSADRELIETLKKQVASQEAIIAQQASTITMLQKMVDKLS